MSQRVDINHEKIMSVHVMYVQQFGFVRHLLSHFYCGVLLFT